ncbi:hypothetical protein C8Q78DRAFT_717821 [Trametes maxima]|nr:hypothetical protein C8Q78DRAFT_717821 [Trametes maxima]
MTTVEHAHCRLGLFHSAEPLHQHGQCKNCNRMHRAEGENMKLLRCSRCSMATYCSKECQRIHWRSGHKDACTWTSGIGEIAVSTSGNTKAWTDLATFVDYHHTSLINSALALFLMHKDEIKDITAQHFVQYNLLYRNDPTLPPYMQFYLISMEFPDRSIRAPIYDMVWAAHEGAMEFAKHDYGEQYWGTGGYLLMIKFSADQQGSLPFWKHFGIDTQHANARLACKDPLDRLAEVIDQGTKLRFCCGKPKDMHECCCGGWTHNVVTSLQDRSGSNPVTHLLFTLQDPSNDNSTQDACIQRE